MRGLKVGDKVVVVKDKMGYYVGHKGYITRYFNNGMDDGCVVKMECKLEKSNDLLKDMDNYFETNERAFFNHELQLDKPSIVKDIIDDLL